ncbi:PEP-CTERM sorting domain-containing protein [Verrucomicrobiaceae bacterium N1E253]|uniref:PEP-CTERM sorting domain-containing protein n=2 Tax=Oceaniferula marina TaxID=2748318 RepID=A0A851GDS2_9BACT|nr:PEP-CTERM sorting domain-containing protein [Oceaniferula marina]
MDFWLIADVTLGTNASKWGAISIYAGSNEDFALGADGASNKWEFDTDGMSDQTSSITCFTGTEARLVLHITGTSVDMWVDPSDTSSVAALGVADKAWSGTDITPNSADWSQIRIGTNDTISVSQLTAATTLAEAVPEPSSTALIGLGGIALILRRRK